MPDRRAQHAGDQVHQRGLAGAVGSDQRVAGAALEGEIDVAGDRERAEALVQPADFERRAHDLAGRTLAPRSSNRPNSPRRANSTTSTSTKPTPNCQNSGLSLER